MGGIQGQLFIHGRPAGTITGGRLNTKSEPHAFWATGTFLRWYTTAGIEEAEARVTIEMPKHRLMKAPPGLGPSGDPTLTIRGRLIDFTTDRFTLADITVDTGAERDKE